MRKKNRRCWRQSLLAILTLSMLFFSATTCKTKPPVLIPIGDARVVAKLPNGNFEVTPAFIMEFKTRGDEIFILKLEIKKLETKGEK